MNRVDRYRFIEAENAGNDNVGVDRPATANSSAAGQTSLVVASPADDGYGQGWSVFGDCGDRVGQVADHALAVGLIGVERQVEL